MNKPSRKVILLPTEALCPQTASFSEDIYSNFAFKDRITNNEFSYSEALSNQENSLRFQEWKPEHSQKALKSILQTYKFTKKFEIECLRSRYNLEHRLKTVDNGSRSSDDKQNTSHSLTFSRKDLFHINKQEFRRVLDHNKTVKEQVLRINQPKHANKQKVGRKNNHEWTKTENSSTAINPQDREFKVYEQSISHMNCEVRVKNQYLLNMPLSLKRKSLIKEQFKSCQRHFANQTRNELTKSSKTFLKQCINKLHFVPLGREQIKLPPSFLDESTPEQNQFISLVHSGYVNQVYLEVLTNPSLAQSTDEKGNNAFHIAALKGNCKMVKGLFKALPLRISASLLGNRNKLGRTPLQKAEMLCEHEVIQCILDYMKQSKLF